MHGACSHICMCSCACNLYMHTCNLYTHTLHTHAHTTHRDILKHTCTRVGTLTPNQVGVGHPLLLPAKTTAWPRNTAFHLPNPSPKHTPSHLRHPASPTTTQSKLCFPVKQTLRGAGPALCPCAPLGEGRPALPPQAPSSALRGWRAGRVPTSSLPRMASQGSSLDLTSRSPEGGGRTQLALTPRATTATSLLT